MMESEKTVCGTQSAVFVLLGNVKFNKCSCVKSVFSPSEVSDEQPLVLHVLLVLLVLLFYWYHWF